MKNICRILILTVISIFMFFIVTFAEINYTSNKKIYTYKGKDVTIKLDDSVIATDIPPIIHESRTLIPIRALIEKLGGKVDWNDKTKTVTIELDDNIINLQIDNKFAIVNGKEVEMDIAVCIAYDSKDTSKGRTVVPIRFVMENLGLDVEWDKNTYTVLISSNKKIAPVKFKNTVTSVKYIVKDEEINIEISTKNSMKYNINDLVDGDRTVIDIENTDFSCSKEDIIISENQVNKIRMGQGEDYARIVIDLNQKSEYTVNINNKKNVFTLTYKNVKSQIKDIDVDIDTKNVEKALINIEGSNLKKYDIRRLTNPERIVLTFFDTELKNDKLSTMKIIDNDYISKINVEYLSNATTITVYIKQQYQYTFNKSSSSAIISIFEKEYKNIEYSNSKEYIFDINLNKNFDMEDIKYNHNRATNVFTLELPSDSVDLGSGSLKIGDKYIKDFEVKTEKKLTIITINGYIVCDFIVSIKDDVLSIKIDKRDISRGVVVVIDPGHVGKGGVGAVYNNIDERIINEDVAKKVIELLEKYDNIEVYTTMGLEYKDLYEATDFANNIGADLFISIHCNAATDAKGNPLLLITGTETYYAVKDTDSHYGITSEKLAQLIQNNLIKKLGSNNRGIKEQPKLIVLRTTNMPSILTELGFMSSPDEFKKLVTTSYRNKCAEAICSGIMDAIDYMKE